MQRHFDGLFLLGPFGSGKTFLGHSLNQQEIASYQDIGRSPA